MSAARVAFASLLLTGCIPAVAHGPHVIPGFGLASSVTVAMEERTHGTFAHSIRVSPGINASYGWRSSSTDLAFSVGSTGIPLLAPDAYLQLPRRALFGLSGGVGVSGSLPTLMTAGAVIPYAQLGRIGSSQSGFYVTQAFVTGLPDSAAAWRSRNRSISTVAYQRPMRGIPGFAPPALWHVNASAVIGSPFVPDPCPEVTCARLRPWGIYLGLIVERRR